MQNFIVNVADTHGIVEASELLHARSAEARTGIRNAKMPSIEERFWSKVNKNGPLWNGTPCWEWQGTRYHDEYGQFSIGGRKVRAHRFSYEYFKGPIPEGLEPDHLCRNHACVNPRHLETVSRSVNLRRGIGPALAALRQTAKTHCPHGHEYTESNTYGWNGWRHCRACRRNRDRGRNETDIR